MLLFDIIVNINLFSPLGITVDTALKYYHKEALIHFKSMFHFYIPWTHQKTAFFIWSFQGVYKWNFGLKIGYARS